MASSAEATGWGQNQLELHVNGRGGGLQGHIGFDELSLNWTVDGVCQYWKMKWKIEWNANWRMKLGVLGYIRFRVSWPVVSRA